MPGMNKISRDEIKALLKNTANLSGGGSSGGATESKQDDIITAIEATDARLEQVVNSDDYVQVVTYLDEAITADRRINTVTQSSASLGITIVDTYNYGGMAGDYYPLGSTRVTTP